LPVKKTEWWGADVVICLERGADLHTAQPMPLTLTVSCFSKIQIGFTFLVLAHLGSPGKRALNGCVCKEAVMHRSGSVNWALIAELYQLAASDHNKPQLGWAGSGLGWKYSAHFLVTSCPHSLKNICRGRNVKWTSKKRGKGHLHLRDGLKFH